MDAPSAQFTISGGVGLASVATPNGRRPQLPNNFFKFPPAARLKAVQQFINAFDYRTTSQTNFNANKFRPLAKLMDTAKMIIYSPQPIKCVEAVFLALYLTAGMPNVERIPVGFETESNVKVHQHLILVVNNGKNYGAFGSSREPSLTCREFEFDSLSSIVSDYKKVYESQLKHTVSKIWIGLPVEHNVESYNLVCWRYLTLEPSARSWKECCKEMDRLTVQSKKLWERWLLDGQGEIIKSPKRSLPKPVPRRPSSRSGKPSQPTEKQKVEPELKVKLVALPP